MHTYVCTSAGPIIDCMNDMVSEGDNIVLQCEASEPVIFFFRGRERACDNISYTYNDTEQDRGSYWKVDGNASSCWLTVIHAESSDSGVYECVCSYSRSRNETEVKVYPEPLLLEVLGSVSGFLVLVVSVLVIILSIFVWKNCRKRKENTSDPGT